MQIGSIIAVYFIVWWLCLFVVLPFKVGSQVDEGEWVPGTERGAPKFARMLPRILVTSALAVVVTGLLIWGLSNPVLREYWH